MTCNTVKSNVIPHNFYIRKNYLNKNIRQGKFKTQIMQSDNNIEIQKHSAKIVTLV